MLGWASKWEDQCGQSSGGDKGQKCRIPAGAWSAPEHRLCGLHTWLLPQLSWLAHLSPASVFLFLFLFFHLDVLVNPGLTPSQ